MSLNEPLGLAFLGCGFATRLHSRTLRRIPGVERFYASRELARAEDFRDRFGGVAAFGTYKAALADPRVQVVLVATPPATHLELTLAALAAGKHVVLEKPPLLRAADFDQVEKAATEARRQVMVAENYFYKPMAEALRHVLAKGEIGEPQILSVRALKEQQTGDWRDQPELAGGGGERSTKGEFTGSTSWPVWGWRSSVYTASGPASPAMFDRSGRWWRYSSMRAERWAHSTIPGRSGHRSRGCGFLRSSGPRGR